MYNAQNASIVNCKTDVDSKFKEINALRTVWRLLLL